MTEESKTIATIKRRIKEGDLVPYLEEQSPKDFLEALSSYPELEDNLKEQLKSNKDWVLKASNGRQIYFIINKDKWKRHKHLHFEPNLRLSFIGPKAVATISINL